MTNTEFLNSKAASEYLGVKLSYLHKLTHQRAIPYTKPNGKMCYFSRADLNAYINRNRVASAIEVEQQADDYIVKGKGGKR